MDWKSHIPLIAILRGITPDEVSAHVTVLMETGIRLIEIPCNSPQWHRSVELAVRIAGKQAVIGAGTVLTPREVDLLADTGATLMVTPNTDPPLIRYAVARGLSCVAGFATPTEAFAALSAGAHCLKLFPAASFGPGYVQALKAVLPLTVSLLAVGGITAHNLSDYLKAGCTGAGLGSDLYVLGQEAPVTRERAESFVRAYQAYFT